VRARAKVLPFPPPDARWPALALLCFRAKAVHFAFRRCSRTTSTWVSAGLPWHLFARRPDMPPTFQVVRAGVALGRRRKAMLAIGASMGNASSRRLRQAGRNVRLAASDVRARQDTRRSRRNLTSPPLIRLQPGQRRTLEVGSCVVLSCLGLGLQLGGWPVWTFPAGIGVYLAWVVLYAEVTVQAKSRPALWQRWPWHGRQRIRFGYRATSESPAQPAHEQRTA
jgi:hypothetical protein